MLALLGWPAASHAAAAMPQGFFVQAGFADRGTGSATLGLAWPWAWQRQWFGGELTGTTEVFLSHWSVRGAGGREAYTQAGLVPLVRYRFSQGRSPWFVEAGIGLSALDGSLRTPHKEFGTSLNFYDVLAAGRSLGAAGRQELSLRLTHVSNANIKRPNPGENFLQLRYLWRF